MKYMFASKFYIGCHKQSSFELFRPLFRVLLVGFWEFFVTTNEFLNFQFQFFSFVQQKEAGVLSTFVANLLLILNSLVSSCKNCICNALVFVFVFLLVVNFLFINLFKQEGNFVV
eukprot:TRINITY_DN5495_c2_g2_i1.p5 TRINITY_DN5495_c2_g2~~TRINITY_DN5495_c2_g2_i1.p5  ORF type:complete len:115 (-),score=1.39 TRINITY_DN5495_c2_g2_i1:591-935(-)